MTNSQAYILAGMAGLYVAILCVSLVLGDLEQLRELREDRRHEERFDAECKEKR